jgi:predicted MFS family arabinose efflux permease
MLPLVGDLAPPSRRASSLAIVVSGLSLGILIARLLSGIVANYTDWRNIYWFSLGAQYLTVIMLYIYMPDYPSKNPGGLNYFRMMGSIVSIAVTEPLLIQASLISFLISAVFTGYWTTLSFLLSSPPYEYSSLTIGLFALIGIIVICSAPIYGRLILDKVVPLFSAVIGLTIELAGVIVGTCIGSFNVAGPVIQAITIDLGAQFTQIANRSAIYGIRPEARNRVNTAYMVACFLGQLTGTAAGNRLYAQGGWVYSSALSSKSSQIAAYSSRKLTLATVAFTGLALVLCLVRGPRETGWFGWSGGWRIWRDDIPPRSRQPQTERALEEADGMQDNEQQEQK